MSDPTPGATPTPPEFDPCSRTTWELANLADCTSPDRPDRHGYAHDVSGEEFDPSPGAEFLRSVAYGVSDFLPSDGEEFDPDDVEVADNVSEVADAAPSVYTYQRWREFVDLAAWDEDVTELGGPDDDMTATAGVALYMIAERLARALVAEYAEEIAEWQAERDEVEA